MREYVGERESWGALSFHLYIRKEGTTSSCDSFSLFKMKNLVNL